MIRWIKAQSTSDVTTEILPVAYQTSAEKLIELIDEIRPEIVVSLGQAEGRSKISLERIAINLNDAQLLDNAGEIRVERKIREDGSPAYFTPLPLRTLIDQLAQKELPLEISLSAGGFVCNHLFYEVLHHLEQLGKSREIWMEFVHLPLVEEQIPEFPGKPVMSVELQGRVILAVLEEIKKLYQANSSA